MCDESGLTTYVGEARSIFPDRGYGFVRTTETRIDIFFHKDELIDTDMKDLRFGDTLEFLIRRDQKGRLLAIDVVRAAGPDQKEGVAPVGGRGRDPAGE